MATVNLRKRKHNDVGDAVVPSSSSRSQSDVLDDAHSLQCPVSPGTHEISGRRNDGGQTYTGSSVSDHGRAHFGNVYNVTNHGSETAREQQYERLMKSLAFKRMDFRLAAIDGAYDETCRWIFHEEQFLRWLDPSLRATHHNLFWIKGNPGSGKSTLMKCIYERLTPYLPECKLVAFFFNARGDVLERSTAGCYRSMLHQMLEQFPTLRTALRIPGVIDEDQEWPIAVVQGMFRESVLHVQRQHLVILVDALDECEQQEVRDMVHFLGSLSKSAQEKGLALNVCFASRHYPGITVRFCEEMTLEGREAHTKDIKHYIWSNLNVDSQTLRRSLMELLLNKSQGVFLWVVLVLRRVNEQNDQCATFDELAATVDALPAQLDTLIENIISEGMMDGCLLPALLWTLVGGRRGETLGLDELCFAIRFCAKKLRSPLRRDDESSYEVNQMKKFIVHASKGLIEHTGGIWSSSCQFIHESVRQHILRGGLAKLHPSLASKVEAASHAMLAEWCQDYIRSGLSKYMGFEDELSYKRYNRRAHNDYRHFRVIELHKDLPLLRYIEDNIFGHLNAAYELGSLALNDLRTFPLEDWKIITNRCCRYFISFEPSASFLDFMLNNSARLHSHSIEKYLLARNPLCSNIPTGEVTRTSNQCYCELVFGKGTGESCAGPSGGPAFTAAIARGFSKLARQVFDQGEKFDLNAFGGDYGTALIAASVHNEVDLVRSFLVRGVDMRLKSDKYGTAIDAARALGHQEITRMLSEAALR